MLLIESIVPMNASMAQNEITDSLMKYSKMLHNAYITQCETCLSQTQEIYIPEPTQNIE